MLLSPQLSLSLFCDCISLSFSHSRLSLPVDLLSSSCRSVCCPHFTPHFQFPPFNWSFFSSLCHMSSLSVCFFIAWQQIMPFFSSVSVFITPPFSLFSLGQISLNLLFSPHLFSFLSLTLSCAGSDSEPLVHLHLLFISFFSPPSLPLSFCSSALSSSHSAA